MIALKEPAGKEKQMKSGSHGCYQKKGTNKKLG